MTANIDWNQFEPVEPMPQESDPITQTNNGIDWNQFEPVEVAEQPEQPKKKRASDLGWLERNFTHEGQRLQAEENRNVLKGVASGLTAGFSELVPGLDVEDSEGGTIGKITGSLLPIGVAAKAIAYPLQLTAKAVPKLAKPIMWLGNLLGISGSGALYEGLEESAQKTLEKGEFVPPSLDTIKNEGAKWGALDIALQTLGLGGRFAKGLYKKANSLNEPVVDVLSGIMKEVGGGDKIAEKAISILENKPITQIEKEIGEGVVTRPQEKAIDLRNKKIAPIQFEKLTNAEYIIPKPYLPAEFSAEKIAEEALDTTLTERIEGHAQRATTEKELGENVQKDIENTIKEHKKKTDADYAIAKEVESTRKPNLKKTADAIVEQIKLIESGGLNLTPEGYNRAKKQLTDTLTDLGYGVETGSKGEIIRAIKSNDIPLSQAVEVKRRLNNIINYDIAETSAQDFLKRPTNALRQDIRVGYGPKNSKARKAFERAEKEFGTFAEQRGKKSIRNLRASEKPESIAGIIRTPSGLADVKSVTSAEQFAQVERELLEYLKGKNQQRVADLYRELRPSLSEDARSIAEQIIESKAPKSSATKAVARRDAVVEKAFNSLEDGINLGTRPEAALNLWKTTEGQQLIKNALENNPNKKEVLKYLQDQSFKDFTSSIVNPAGEIDFKSLDKLLKDPATLNNLRLVAGEEGVAFLKQLETLSNRIKKNASILENTISKSNAGEREKIRKVIEKRGKERFKKAKEKRETATKEAKLAAEEKEKSRLIYKIDDLVRDYGVKAKGLFGLIGLTAFGPGTTIPAAISYELVSRMAKSPAVRDSIRKAAAAPHADSVAILQSILNLGDVVE